MGTETGVCWWCRETVIEDALVHLEGARLVGSPPLPLPLRLSERQRLELRVCRVCAIAFADCRARHDSELAEGAFLPGGTSGPSRTVEAIVRKAIGAEGDQE